MSTTQVAEINRRLRAAGIVVHEAPGWQSRSNGYISAFVGGLVHHTATGYGNAVPGSGVYNLLVNGRGAPNPLSGPLCNYAGNEDGSLTVIAAGPANHAGASGGRSMGPLPVEKLFNTRVLGLEVVYPGDKPMTEAQYRTALVWARVVADVVGRGDIERVRAHAETSITGKWDPGYAPSKTIDMRAFRAAASNPIPAPTIVEDEDMQLIKGDKDPTVFVVYWNAPGAIAVRKRVPNDKDPGYVAARAAGYTIKTVPQDIIDAVPDAKEPTPPAVTVDFGPVLAWLAEHPPVAAVTADTIAAIAAAVIAEGKKEGN